jgi:hypothetical protein
VVNLIALVILVILLLSSLIPLIQAIPLMLLTMLIYGLVDGFHHLTPLFLAGMLMIMIFSFFVDNIASALSARTCGASKYGLWGALIGGAVGFVVDPVVGIILGPFVGTVMAELIFVRKGWGSALKVGVGTFLGYAYGSVMRFILALAMVTAFVLRVY